MRWFAIACVLAVIGAASVDGAAARECCNVTCGAQSPVCRMSDDFGCDQLCDTQCAGSGGCTTFLASTCAPGLEVVACDSDCGAVCAPIPPPPIPAAAPTMSPGVLAVLATVLAALAVASLTRTGRRPVRRR